MKIKLDKQGRPTALIKFTRRQQASIGLLLAAIRDMGGHGAIIGQVYGSGIACKLCDPAEVARIAAATGATPGTSYFPEQQT